MMDPSWLRISGALCFFGFLRELRPSEPYYAEILLSERFNLTQDDVNREVYPVGTYCYLTLLIVVFLITDFLKYKPMIIASALTGIIVWSLPMCTKTLLGLQVAEVFYGFYQAAEVAYYAYIYAKVDKKYYPRVTSHTRAAIFVGKLVAGLSGQLILFFELMSYYQLIYITVSSQVIALFWAIGLPSVDKSLYFHRREQLDVLKVGSIDNTEAAEDAKIPPAAVAGIAAAPHTNKTTVQPLQLLWSHFHTAYKNVMVLQWSLWYAINTAGYLQVVTYVQVLWKSFENEPKLGWNGGVDAACTALAALFSLLAGYTFSGRFKNRAILISLSVLAALEGACVVLCAWTNNIYISYLGYILFGGLFGFSITVVSAELAKTLEEDSFALIFGINTLLALVLQTVLTVIVVSKRTNLDLSSFEQFNIYAYCYFAIGLMYFLAIITQYVKKNYRTK